MKYMILSNLSEGAIVALKMVGGVLAATVLLYLVLILSRRLGMRIEENKYKAYCDKYRSEHGTEEGMLSKEDFVETRAAGNAVVWKRSDHTPKVMAGKTPETTENRELPPNEQDAPPPTDEIETIAKPLPTATESVVDGTSKTNQDETED